MAKDENNWSEWKKLVLRDLQNMKNDNEELTSEVKDINTQFQKYEKNIEELIEWKKELKDNITIDDLKEMKEAYKNFGKFLSRFDEMNINNLKKEIQKNTKYRNYIAGALAASQILLTLLYFFGDKIF